MDRNRYNALPIDPACKICVETSLPVPYSDLQIAREVDACWESAKRQGADLYDGSIFSVHTVTPQKIIGGFVPYRYYVAWRKRPEIRSKVPLKPLSISGITHSRDEVLIGKRSLHIHQYPGQYEFAPSGGVDKESESNGLIDYTSLVLRELEEDTGIVSADVSRVQLFSLIEDLQEQSLELCFDIEIHGSFSCNSSSHEYSVLMPWKIDSVEAFLKQQGKDWVPFCLRFWEEWRRK